ncbi:MAG TPA: peptidoglycan-binding domain-containing protein [Coleofasciculaceae cyanobacterium]
MNSNPEPPAPPESAPLTENDQIVSDILRRGDRSNLVQIAQHELNMRGFDAGQPDGMFGPQTEIAVKQAQAAYGLTPDGIIGAATWERLGFTFR